MARTYRRVSYYFIRNPKTTNSRRGEYCTVRDMLEEEVPVRNRFRARGSLTSRKIPNSWDDISVAAWKEKHGNMETNESC